MIDSIIAGGVVILILVVAITWAYSMGMAIARRRAWNLWVAGLIDDEELKRRLGKDY